MSDSLIETRLPPALATAPLIDPAAPFVQNYNASSFMFAHGLSGHELFKMPQLRALARRLEDHPETYWANGRVLMQDRWEAGRDGRLSLDETMATIEENDSLVILKHTEQDRVYAPLLQGFLARVVELAGDVMRQDIIVGEVLILVSSPDRLTPYHMDAETNFLVQITGDKTVRIYDQEDRSLVTHAEREGYFAGDHNSATFRPEKAEEGTLYNLRAGHAVHIPVFAPHWVQNGDNVSVSLSVNYELRSVKDMAEVYLMNRYLRRLGLSPLPPGQQGARDDLKRAAARAIGKARSLKSAPATSVPGWRPTLAA